MEGALARLNAGIAAAPADASLWVERGELYAQHEDWTMAEANYLRAAELTPDDPRLARARGSLALRTGHPAEARTHLDPILERDPRDAEALVLRSRARAALGEREAAAADLAAALGALEAPRPELFLEHAGLLPPTDALRILDAALQRLGPVFTLELRALTLEETTGRIDAALARLDRLAARSERKENWLKRRGDLLVRAGRPRDAIAAYTSALAAIADLPPWLRESPDTTVLAAELTRLTSSRS